MAVEKDKHKDHSMSTSEAGRMGGEKVRDERGPKFYSEIGRQQGKDNNPGNFANRPKEDVQAAGRRGGRPPERPLLARWQRCRGCCPYLVGAPSPRKNLVRARRGLFHRPSRRLPMCSFSGPFACPFL